MTIVKNNKMNFKKNMWSNIVFIVVIAALIYPNSRAWLMRQVAFAPSVNAVEKSPSLSTYQWELKGINTPDINFESLKGKVVFVNFWATWCPPCRAEMPLIQKLYNDYKTKVDFVFVTSDPSEKVTSYYQEHQLDLPTYNMHTQEPSEFVTRSIPATYIVSKKGKIVVSTVGAADWNSDKVRKLLDKLLADNNQ
ncbi:MAG: thiol-disulfide oxidoreductase [Flavobacteriales bacterium CG_4_9_14_0_2_um_filter_35_242]|nr:MAG: thiol-disulfide oxidoreductase [Flavobacteriales bacterium CG11_big_fil_rev_8_21_14_0_20_35_7]PIV15902.1 MAG: thiol-disulfide oxidoreductase [Flavobacteriales bacterium CG03_land_8_20_14_0_80_35_15]PIX07212.1 MAG: thiol-disulfide oxidoreductase [Flavobacteriales bacterium CG_4_8_14_3_um_filter_35_10]PJA05572.1 MAG: thiol-disulfide oxidoreductase [Flavobacteriales bacterium CG_4_10_14_0_2_um_filter_35_18]PJC60366.1 MAG: thiol-disulfide oxidoreductase [Flavobacteriales bacterium CG_4_9_14